MSEVESLINIPVEHCSNIFGQFDEYAKVIEKTLKVTIIVRDSSVKDIEITEVDIDNFCLLYTSPSPRDRG